MSKDVRRKNVIGNLARAVFLALAKVRGKGFALGEFVGYQSWLADSAPSCQALDLEREYWRQSVGPLISVVIPTYNAEVSELRVALDSLLGQTYENWECVLVDDGSGPCQQRDQLLSELEKDPRFKILRLAENLGISLATKRAVSHVQGDLVAFLDHDDVLVETALSKIAMTAAGHPNAKLFYSDEDKLDGHGRRCDPYFKPDFTRALLYSRNFINHLTVVREDVLRLPGLFREEMDGAQDFDLVLRVLEQFGDRAFVHVPEILYHWRVNSPGRNFSSRFSDRSWKAGAECLHRHIELTERGLDVKIVQDDTGGRRLHFIRRPGSSRSVIIPSRDNIDLLTRAVATVKTADPDAEIVIVDNGSKMDVTASGLASLKSGYDHIRILEVDEPFNYSRLVNLGAEASTGQMLCFLNDDVWSKDNTWLAEMLGWASMSWVGAVGARLDYPDGRIQHGGIFLGPNRTAGHFGKMLPSGSFGPFSHLKVVRGVSAVTAACLVVRRSVFERVQGFDAENFPVAFSDVDFCLRIRQLGLENVWTPHACLYHIEGHSRGHDGKTNGEEYQKAVVNFTARWAREIQRDRYLGDGLDSQSEKIQLRRR